MKQMQVGAAIGAMALCASMGDMTGGTKTTYPFAYQGKDKRRKSNKVSAKTRQMQSRQRRGK